MTNCRRQQSARIPDTRSTALAADRIPIKPSVLPSTAAPVVKIASRLLELHDDLFSGNTGRSVNGLGALLVIVLSLTGIVVWWPGIKTWRRSLIVHRNVGWRRFTWDLHSMIGVWTLGFIVLFALSGAYLGNP